MTRCLSMVLRIVVAVSFLVLILFGLTTHEYYSTELRRIRRQNNDVISELRRCKSEQSRQRAAEFEAKPFEGSRFNLNLNITKRWQFPETEPRVCIAFLSCKRFDLLAASIAQVVYHFEKFEPDLKYEIAVFDQGSPDDSELQEVITQFEVEKLTTSRVNYGMSYGFNVLFFGLCRAPYILSMEDDWLWSHERSKDLPMVTYAANALQMDASLIGVMLREAHSEQNTSWIDIPGGGQYRKLKQIRSGKAFMSYVNGGILLNRANMIKVGHLSPESISDRHVSEVNYKDRVAAAGFESAIVKRVEQEECDRWPHAKYPSTDCHSVILHAGKGRQIQ